MKKILLPFFLLLTTLAHAQLNNSWIDYSKTYYKFRLVKSGVYRISQSTLTSAGLQNVPAEQFQLWRNGQQVALYTSVANGALSSNDYLEFLGKGNDGIPDQNLYLDPNFQLSNDFSLFTDTAAYFLTVSNAGNNLRYSSSVNDVADNTLQPDAYFMNRVENPYEVQVNRGYEQSVGEPLYSSAYDQGESWVSDFIGACPGCPLVKQFNNLNVYTAGPQNNVSFYISAFGNSLASSPGGARDFKVKLFNNTIFEDTTKFFSIIKQQVNNLPLSLLQSPDYVPVSMGFTDLVLADTFVDNMVVAKITLTYPAKFNFNNQQNFYFELAANPSGNYLVIDNFNNGSTAPVLYDINNGTRYIGDISTPGKVKFALPGSTDDIRKFMLVSEDASNVIAVNTLTQRNFVDFSNTDNQADYIIISNPALYNDGNGVNNVEKYRQYRASVQGGSYNAKTINIDELNDQFAFGIKKHPAAIRDFIRYAQSWPVKPKYVFIIGHGLASTDFRANESAPAVEKLDLVQSFGWPASDQLLVCIPGQNVPLVPIGRLSAISGAEVGNYLQKMDEYEKAQQTPSCSIADKGWMKNFIHVAGGATLDESNSFVNYLNGYKTIAESDTLMGADVQTFAKQSSAYVEQVSGQQIQQIINGGAGFIGYLGHSSANTLAFNLSEPEDYQNQGKYPFFNVSGCDAGNFFVFDSTRLTGSLSISEKWVLTPERGCIGFFASTHLGIPFYLDIYVDSLYKLFCRKMYGNTIGNQVQEVLRELGGNSQSLGDNGGYFMRIHLEELTLHGDPALRINYFAQPDYAVEDQTVKINPSVVSVADNNFTVNVKWQNIGKSIDDSMRVIVQRRLPNGTLDSLYNQVILATQNTDSLNFTLPINPTTDKGTNQIIVTLDADNRIPESCETNNTVTKNFVIFEDELNPVYPYNYSIVNQQNITYSASTANPLSGQRQYTMEIDTTELFNSPFKKQYTLSGPGGVIQFTPTNITFTDSTVYYWRTTMVPLDANTQTVWHSFSFVYLPTGGPGFNQSHYYQQIKSIYTNISLDADRVYRFGLEPRNLTIATGLYPAADYTKIYTNLDFDQLTQYGCTYNSLQVIVYDSLTLTPWQNYLQGGSRRFGSATNVNCGESLPYFEFPYGDPVYRKNFIKFITDSIPDGDYVSITNLGTAEAIGPVPANTSFISDWQSDAGSLGVGNTMYDKLKSIGFIQIDSFTHNIPFAFLYRKNRSSYEPQQIVGSTDTSLIAATFPLVSKASSGTIESPLFGPARQWQSLHWRGNNIDPGPGDSVKIQVYGVKADGVTTDSLATVVPATDTSLSFIDANVYPYVKLVMQNKDSVFITPDQMRYWRINAAYEPEGAIAPNIAFNMKDTFQQGEKIYFELAFKNVSSAQFADSMKIEFKITNGSTNVDSIIFIPKGKILMSGDTLLIRDTINTKGYPGTNTLYVMFNPGNDQPEQYLFNNFLYKSFYVTPDKYDPTLDVTFDGVHILNKDIVSAKPRIVIKLKDENKYLSLNDTSLIKVQVYFPSLLDPSQSVLYTYHFGDSMQFVPADLANGENTASIILTPNFPTDGQYELIVSGKDVESNTTGNLEYRVAFNVINKTMISNLFNYPNPFTTSTAFVFTITGSEIPQNMRIQILTITGKVVREITQSELGPLHVGDNITEYKWDGTDMYGQKLANGVYLYRVLTNLNGKSIEQYNGTNANGETISSGLQDANKFFTKGYGKMYLMR